MKIKNISNIILIPVIWLVLIVFNRAQAQYVLTGNTVSTSIPSVALMDIEPNTSTITLELTQPAEAGSGMDTSLATDNSKWINYTSSNSVSITRKITVQITSGTVPSGLVLRLSIGSYTGNGVGLVFGTPASTLQLSGTSQNILTGISSCRTGDGITNGHNLTYAFRITNYGNLKKVAGGSLMINYTLMDE